MIAPLMQPFASAPPTLRSVTIATADALATIRMLVLQANAGVKQPRRRVPLALGRCPENGRILLANSTLSLRPRLGDRLRHWATRRKLPYHRAWRQPR